LRRWKLMALAVLAIAAAALLRQLSVPSARQSRIPAGISLAGVPVGGLTEDEATQLLEEAFSAPLILNYLDEALYLFPQKVGFRVRTEEMLAELRRLRPGPWGDLLQRLLRRPVRIADVPLRADYSEAEIRRFLSEVAARYDRPPRQPQAVLKTLSFSPGRAGRRLDVEASLPLVIEALTSAERRQVDLVVETLPPPKPTIELLGTLLEERLADFPGVAGIFVKDLASGEELGINADVAFSGMSLVKVAIVEEAYRLLDGPPDARTARLLTETLTQRGNFAANQLLEMIGDGDARRGTERLTESLRYLGLANTFMAAPYGEGGPLPGITTPANSRRDVNTEPDPYLQTTPKDMGLLMEMIYQCAQGGGTLIAAYPDDLTPAECRAMLATMKANRQGEFIAAGLPEGTPVAHKHGWIDDTHADVGVVFSPGGDYVLSIILHRHGWLEWEVSSPLMADISRATYNYFNLKAR